MVILDAHGKYIDVISENPQIADELQGRYVDDVLQLMPPANAEYVHRAYTRAQKTGSSHCTVFSPYSSKLLQYSMFKRGSDIINIGQYVESYLPDLTDHAYSIFDLTRTGRIINGEILNRGTAIIKKMATVTGSDVREFMMRSDYIRWKYAVRSALRYDQIVPFEYLFVLNDIAKRRISYLIKKSDDTVTSINLRSQTNNVITMR